MDAGSKRITGKQIFIYVIIFLVISFSVKSTEQRIALVSAIGTIVAAYAAWQAAREAAKSAEIARESMNATKELGLETLKETQMANQRTAFESRYTMLLAHHDHYHQQLCDYLDTYWHKNKVSEITEEEKLRIGEIENFFSKSIYAESPNDCFSFLTGHQIISRYMRVLYHLLKFVYENGAFKESEKIRFQKNYTSPVRSTIRNDVLLLIAVNALNVRSKGAKNSSYPFYQQMLHEFSFFEHAIFMFPSNPNSLFSQDDWESRIHDLVITKQSDFSSKLRNQMGYANHRFKIPEVRLISPLVIVLYIFENPMRKAVLKAFDSLSLRWEINGNIIDKIKEAEEQIQYSSQYVKELPSSEYQSPSNMLWRKISEEIVSEIEENAFSKYGSYDNYVFKMAINGKIMPVKGKYIRDHVGAFKRAQSIVEHYKSHNGDESYAHYLAQCHDETISNSLKEIESYNVMSRQYTPQQPEIAEEK